jgi:hypothetical protein
LKAVSRRKLHSGPVAQMSLHLHAAFLHPGRTDVDPGGTSGLLHVSPATMLSHRAYGVARLHEYAIWHFSSRHDAAVELASQDD